MTEIIRHEFDPKPVVTQIEHLGGVLVVELSAEIGTKAEAEEQWQKCGGQHRTFGEHVDIETLDFSDWLIVQRGVRVIAQAKPTNH